MKPKIKTLCVALCITVMSYSSEINHMTPQDSVTYDVLFLLSNDVLNDSVINYRWSHVGDSNLEYYKTLKMTYLERKTYYDSLSQSVESLYHTMNSRSSAEIEESIKREKEYFKKNKKEKVKNYNKLVRLYKSKKTYYDSLWNARLDSVSVSFPCEYDTITINTRTELKQICSIEHLLNDYKFSEDWRDNYLNNLKQELTISKKEDKQRALYSGLNDNIEIILLFKTVDNEIEELEHRIEYLQKNTTETTGTLLVDDLFYKDRATALKEHQLQLAKLKNAKQEYENNILLQQINESFNKQHTNICNYIHKLDSVEYESLSRIAMTQEIKNVEYIDSLLTNCDWMRKYAEYFYYENEKMKNENYYNSYNEESECYYTAFYEGNEGSLCYSCKCNIPEIIGTGSTFRTEIVICQEKDSIFMDERLTGVDYGNGVRLVSGTWQGWTFSNLIPSNWSGVEHFKEDFLFPYYDDETDSLIQFLVESIVISSDEYFLGTEEVKIPVSEKEFNESLQYATDSLFSIYGQPCPIKCVPINVCQVIKRYKSLILGINEDTTIRNTDRKANTRIVYPAKYETSEPFSFSDLLLYLISQDLISEVMKNKSK